MAEQVDRRVRRTRELLRGALVALMQEKPYDRITVQDILERADVGRSTFYAHFRDKDDLVRSGFADIREALEAERHAAARGASRPSEFLEPMRAVFRHVERYRFLGARLTPAGGGNAVTNLLQQHAAELLRAHLQATFPGFERRGPDAEAAVRFVLGACMGLVGWWLREGPPYSADEIFTIFRRIASQGVRRFLAA
jgi:AcrR family transcriptional regulator